MHNFLIKLFLLLLSVSSCAQTAALTKLERELLVIEKKIYKYDLDVDSVQFYSNYFSDKLINYIQKNPSTLEYDFNLLRDSSTCHVTTSEDGLFRIYSWDTHQEGSMHFYKVLYQYRGKDRVYSEVVDREGEPLYFYSKIHTLKTGGHTYYMGLGHAILSARDRMQFVNFFEIEDKQLNDTIALVLNEDHSTSGQLRIHFNYFSLGANTNALELIKYVPGTKTFLVPLVDEKGNLTEKYEQFKFNGKHFERQE